MSIRVIVADDHPAFRSGVSAILDAVDDIEVIAQAEDGQQVIELVEKHNPDVVLMDLRMPNMNGIDATARVSQQTSVLVFTMNEDDESLAAAIRAGARGYLLKEASGDDIERAVKAVARGEAVFGSSIAGRVLASLGNKSSADSLAKPAFPQLTDRERDILELVAQGLDNPVIAAELFLSEKTVRNNVSNILNKLQLTTRAALVAEARDAGMGRR